MTDSNLSTPILGFELTRDPLLGDGFFPLQQGLTVIYGLNGAGKTRLLRGIRAALTGIRDDVELGMIVHADVSESHGRWYRESSQPRPFLIALAQTMLLDASDKPFDDEGMSAHEREMTWAEASKVVEGFIQKLAGSEDPDLTAEVSESRRFLLMPTGTAEHPSWDAWAVADLSRPGAARVNTELAQLERDWHENSPDENDAWMEALEEWNDRVGRHALFTPDNAGAPLRRRLRAAFPTRHVPYAAFLAELDFMRGQELNGSIDFGMDVLDLEQDPYIATAEHFSLIAIGAEWTHDNEDPADSVASAFKRGPVERPSWLKTPSSEKSALIESWISDAASALSEYANRNLAQALPDAPTMSLVVNPPAMRFSRHVLEWRFGRAGVGIEGLSRAERQWAVRAINYALETHRRQLAPPADPVRPRITIIDEPEAALHRAAEEQMAAFLVGHAEDPREVVVAATHSPELLDSPRAHVIEVQRGGGTLPGSSLVHELDLADRTALDRLGLTPSDLLRWPRVILLVEGMHDQTLFEAFLGDRLRAARVMVLPMHGGTKLAHTIDSQVLFNHTRAHLFTLLDNTIAELVRDVWDQAQEAAARGDIEGAKNIVVEGITDHVNPVKNPDGEAGYLRTWLTSALSAGLDGRITPMGLERADIIEYLPVERIVPTATSWEELRDAHQADRARPSSNTPKDFKKWLTAKHHFDFAPAALREAARGVDVPREFERVMKEIEARSAMSGTVEAPR